MLIDPVVVVEVRRHVRALHRGAFGPVQRPAFGALTAVRAVRLVAGRALADVQARQVAAAGEGRPHHAVAGDIDPARVKARFGDAKDLRPATRRRILAAHQADDVAGIGLGGTPQRVVDRARNDRVEAVGELRVVARVGLRRRLDLASRGLFFLGPDGIDAVGVTARRGDRDVPGLRDRAVAVRVDDQGAPADGLLLVAGLVEDLRVDPGEAGAAAVEVHGLVGVVVELQVVSREAGLDQREPLRHRVEEGGVTAAGPRRPPGGVPVLRVAAPGRRAARAADLGGQPDAALAVDHRVVRVGRVVGRIAPDVLVAPEEGRPHRRREA